ncbi:MAG: RNA polymerase sigma factor region1.1 domain-containing protein, partial [Deltaproteobacteria bacterium]|nr:RNA polymerase sigma factor region1.1 domain-containing protein [Deltaproteobacteria bacterium]
MTAKNSKANVANNVGSSGVDMSSLIDIGKDRGFLTYDEINDAFPENNFSVEDMDNLLETLGDLGIDVVDGAEKTPESRE